MIFCQFYYLLTSNIHNFTDIFIIYLRRIAINYTLIFTKKIIEKDYHLLSTFDYHSKSMFGIGIPADAFCFFTLSESSC